MADMVTGILPSKELRAWCSKKDTRSSPKMQILLFSWVSWPPENVPRESHPNSHVQG